MDKRKSQIVDALKNGPQSVRKLRKTTKMGVTALQTCLEDMYEEKIVSYKEVKRKKEYFLLNKGQMNFSELVAEFNKEFQKIKKDVDEAISEYTNNPNSRSLSMMVDNAEIILGWLQIFQIYKSGLSQDEWHKLWLEYEFKAQKLLNELTSADPIVLRNFLKVVKVTKIETLHMHLDKTKKELSEKN